MDFLRKAQFQRFEPIYENTPYNLRDEGIAVFLGDGAGGLDLRGGCAGDDVNHLVFERDASGVGTWSIRKNDLNFTQLHGQYNKILIVEILNVFVKRMERRMARSSSRVRIGLPLRWVRVAALRSFILFGVDDKKRTHKQIWKRRGVGFVLGWTGNLRANSVKYFCLAMLGVRMKHSNSERGNMRRSHRILL